MDDKSGWSPVPLSSPYEIDWLIVLLSTLVCWAFVSKAQTSFDSFTDGRNTDDKGQAEVPEPRIDQCVTQLPAPFSNLARSNIERPSSHVRQLTGACLAILYGVLPKTA